MSFIKKWFSENNKTGCRYITVDALKEAELFYRKSEFKPLVTPDKEDETILMYYDLKQFTK